MVTTTSSSTSSSAPSVGLNSRAKLVTRRILGVTSSEVASRCSSVGGHRNLRPRRWHGAHSRECPDSLSLRCRSHRVLPITSAQPLRQRDTLPACRSSCSALTWLEDSDVPSRAGGQLDASPSGRKMAAIHGRRLGLHIQVMNR
jgi:hypothetical protein